MIAQDLIIGNALDVLRSMPSESIDTCVTSPPYWALRDYGTDPVIWGGSPDCDHKWDETSYCTKCGAWRGQLGLEPTYEEYIAHLCEIFDEVRRVLKPTGSCWVNIGDTYNGDKKGNTDVFKNGKVATSTFVKAMDNSLGPKSLCMIPYRFAIEMCARGWILRNVCIWHKPNVMPQSMTDRLTVDFEPFFFFSKEPTYYFKQIMEPVSSSIKGRRTRNGRTTWSIPTVASKLGHIAMFPSQLIDKPIQSSCPEGGTVLDPFAGSGTVLQYCKEHDLNAIGIDINPTNQRIADIRLKNHITRLDQWMEADLNHLAKNSDAGQDHEPGPKVIIREEQ